MLPVRFITDPAQFQFKVLVLRLIMYSIDAVRHWLPISVLAKNSGQACYEDDRNLYAFLLMFFILRLPDGMILDGKLKMINEVFSNVRVGEQAQTTFSED